jgi:hypothetical protein
MQQWILWVAAGIAIWVLPTHAHHSIANAYDTRREVTIEGVVTQFHFISPHPVVTIDVQDGGGSQPWLLEMDNRSELARIGMTGQTLKPADRVVVTGNPATGGRQSLYIRRLDRPADGFRYEQVGRSPRIRAAR